MEFASLLRDYSPPPIPQTKAGRSSEEIKGTLPLYELFKTLSKQQQDEMEKIVAEMFCKINLKSKNKGSDIMRSPFVRFRKDGTVIFICSSDRFGFALCGKVPKLPSPQSDPRTRIRKGEDLCISNAAYHIFAAVNSIK